ncbi:MAG: flavodoxin family protein [Lachnospiraceae bacterium]|nr:flavodoxin family protein [Lachnospiraceae bacterium]
MKILVFNGSPKGELSDTMHITRAFLCGMKETADQEINIINAIDKKIEPCTGCFSCMGNGGNCILKDDMKNILEEILSSDLLIWSFPLFCYGMPAPLKALLDRTLPLSSMTMQKVGDRYEHVGQADISHLRYLMICGCGFPNSRHNFEPAVAQFGLCFPGEHPVITIPESPIFNVPEASAVTVPRLALVKQAGKQYAETGKINAAMLSEICSPMIPEEEYAAIVNGGVKNE